jgi:riboflavin kinase/FMN adenylyltransferase
LKTNNQTIKIVGRVTSGNALGHLLGFPTANLKPTVELAQVADGVWAAWASVEGRDYMAVVNIGCSPSVVENGERRVEAHLVDFEGDIYNQEITLRLLFHLREERKFPSREALVEQIARDKQEAIALLTDAKNI